MRRVGVFCALLVESALRGLQSTPVISLAAVFVIAASLVLVGGFGLVVGNMQGMLDGFGRELHVRAFLDPALDEADARALAARAAGLEGVEQIELVTKQEALLRFQSQAGNDLLADLEANPLPSSLEITPLPEHRTAERVAALEAAVAALPGVAELGRGQDWVRGYARAATVVRIAAWGLGSVLLAAALLIVANTIRLALYARADELEILDLVGASPSYVRTPFLLEGLLQGFVGSLLALVALWLVHQLALPRFEAGLALFLGSTSPRFFTSPEIAVLLLGGASLGATGSIAALVGWRS